MDDVCLQKYSNEFPARFVMLVVDCVSPRNWHAQKKWHHQKCFFEEPYVGMLSPNCQSIFFCEAG